METVLLTWEQNNMPNDNDPMAKYWANRATQMGQQNQRPTQQAPHNHMGREIDATNIMQQRAMMGAVMNQQQSSNSQIVYLREGAKYYRQIQNESGFGTTTPLIRSMGPLSNVGAKEFSVKGEIKGYCVDDLPRIDLSKMNEEPARMLTLIRVSAPFAGDILIEEKNIIRSNAGRTVLKG